MFDEKDQRSVDPAIWLQQHGKQFSERMSLMPDWLAGFVVKEIPKGAVRFFDVFFRVSCGFLRLPGAVAGIAGGGICRFFFQRELPPRSLRGGRCLFYWMTLESGDIHKVAGENKVLTTVSHWVRAEVWCAVWRGVVRDESFCGVGTEEPGECEASGGADASSDAG